MRHGLSEETIAAITGVLSAFPEVEKAVVYGSRAQGNYKRGSDIDLTLFGAGITDNVMSQVYWGLEDLLLPYKIDLSAFAKLTHRDLIDHIQRVGVTFYEKEPTAARKP